MSQPDERRPEEPAPVHRVEGLEEFRRKLSVLKASDYRLSKVVDDQGVLRINIVLNSIPAGAEELREQTMAALRDVQDVIGVETTFSVWASQPTLSGRLALGGMGFFSAATETYHFKGADELEPYEKDSSP